MRKIHSDSDSEKLQVPVENDYTLRETTRSLGSCGCLVLVVKAFAWLDSVGTRRIGSPFSRHTVLLMDTV